MDQLISAFTSLGVDHTIAHQFVVFLVIFLVLKFVFFNKLQFVLEMRENKTVKMEKEANEKLHRVEKLAEQYKGKMDEAQVQGHRIYVEKKTESLNEQRDAIKSVEKDLNAKIESERKKFADQLEVQKTVIMKESDRLADQLVQKLT